VGPADLGFDLLDELADLGRRHPRLRALDANHPSRVIPVRGPHVHQTAGEQGYPDGQDEELRNSRLRRAGTLTTSVATARSLVLLLMGPLVEARRVQDGNHASMVSGHQHRRILVERC
jgi:hypothetical protein